MTTVACWEIYPIPGFTMAFVGLGWGFIRWGIWGAKIRLIHLAQAALETYPEVLPARLERLERRTPVLLCKPLACQSMNTFTIFMQFFFHPRRRIAICLSEKKHLL